MNQNCLVSIIGGGPSGMATALFLAKKGIRAEIFEKDKFPRDKICGDAIGSWTLRLMEQMDPGMVERYLETIPHLPCHGARLFAPNFKRIDFAMPNKHNPKWPSGLITRRIDFDNFLYTEAKANPLIVIHENAPIDSVSEAEGGLLLENSNRNIKKVSPLVIFADGANSPYYPDKNKNKTRHHITAIKSYYKNVKGFHRDNFIDVYLLEDTFPGYLWIFPLPENRANVGLGIRTDILKKNKVNLKSLMLEAIENNPQLKSRFKDSELEGKIQAWPLPTGSIKRSMSGKHYLKVGDSAGNIDPISGEGVANALLSGRMAADMIEKAINANNFSSQFLQEFDSLFYKKMWGELRNSRRLQFISTQKRLLNYLIYYFADRPVLVDRIRQVIYYPEKRNSLLNPFFYLRAILGL